MSNMKFSSGGVFGDVALVLDAEAKQNLQRSERMSDQVEGALARCKARGITLEQVLGLCDLTTTHPELPGMIFPSYAIYANGQIRAYIPTQYAKPQPTCYTRVAQEVNSEQPRQGSSRPSMPRRSSSLWNHRGSHPNIRSLYTDDEAAAANRLTEGMQKLDLAKANPSSVPNLDRKASRQSIDKKSSRRSSRSNSVASSQTSHVKPKERRISRAYSLASLSSSSAKSSNAGKKE